MSPQMEVASKKGRATSPHPSDIDNKELSSGEEEDETLGDVGTNSQRGELASYFNK